MRRQIRFGVFVLTALGAVMVLGFRDGLLAGARCPPWLAAADLVIPRDLHRGSR